MTADAREPMKPCPFCGIVPTDRDLTSSGIDLVFVLCECGGEGPAGSDSSGAIAAWNRRAPDALLSSENEKLAGMVKEKETARSMTQRRVENLNAYIDLLHGHKFSHRCHEGMKATIDSQAEEIASLRRLLGTERDAFGKRESEYLTELNRIAAALTQAKRREADHREAAKGLVELLENIAKGPEARIPVAAWTSAVRLAIREHLSNFAALTLSEAKTAPQEPKANDEGIAPEEGKS